MSRDAARGLALPAFVWLGLFLLAPMVIVASYSVATRGTYGGVVPGFSLENFIRATDWIYLRILWNSLKLATLTTFSCFLLGFPLAYVMATSGPRTRGALLILVVLPFWTNFVVRAYALKLLLPAMGLASLVNSAFAVWLGMMTNYLPFMVLPIYVALERLDFTLVEAAKDLGARPIQVLFKVLLPLSRPGIVSGCVFVFTPALGEFVIPDLLGGARTMLIGNLVTDQFLKSRDWPFGSALSLLLIGLVTVSLALYLRHGGEGSPEKRKEAHA